MIIVGVDEVGRGSLVGNVIAAAVIVPKNFKTECLIDSKLLSEKKRELIYYEIISKCQYAIGSVSSTEIDKINIHHASLLAMYKAVTTLLTADEVLKATILVDGKYKPKLDCENLSAIIKGDTLHPCISAASIVAKVYRDNEMKSLDNEFPQFGFSSHKGYATKKHKTALKEFGIIKQHRLSYKPVKEIIELGSNFII